MGWFDKKSWRLRAKIKDLQADLREAEKEGKYVLQDGLFFAELDDMGEATMMVFGQADQFASSEESVIRAFFDRNGYTVETLKLDKSRTGLQEVEIIPPEEMTRAIGRALKSEGYRLIDDSEKERPANREQKIYPLSGLVRAMAILFAEKVQYVTSNTRVKMNKEGNRLLHWMPKIIECLEQKIDDWVVDECRPAFNNAYEQFYGRIGHATETRQAPRSGADMDSSQRIPPVEFPSKGDESAKGDDPAPSTDAWTPSPPPVAPAAKSPAASTPPPSRSRASASAAPATPPPTEGAPVGKPQAESTDRELVRAMKERDMFEAQMKMYRTLIQANASRCVRNSELLLKHVHDFFTASATCVLVKVPNGHGLTIHAQAGKRLLWGEGSGGEGFAVSSTVLGDCVKKRLVVTSETMGSDPSSSMLQHNIESTAAAPIVVGDDIVAILYIDRRGGMRHFNEEDSRMLAEFALVFQEYPDLTLGLLE